jgi:hypothetical protein
MAKKAATEHLEIAQEVSNWAKKYNSHNDLTKNLVADLESKSNLHKWAELDPFEFLPYPGTVGSEKKNRLIDNLTVLRNVLVFAPVALTWAAVGQATTAFEKYTAANDGAVVNFLEFWQNGYGVLDAKWRISEVARFDFILILLVIILTLFISYAGQKLAKSEILETSTIDDSRQFLAAKLTFFFVDKKKITNVTFNQSLAGSVQRLVAATAALEKSAKEISKVSKRLPKQD